jgi:hypothetical protein
MANKRGQRRHMIAIGEKTRMCAASSRRTREDGDNDSKQQGYTSYGGGRMTADDGKQQDK